MNEDWTERFYQTIYDNIVEHGQHLVGVFPTKENDDPPFIYTIGNCVEELPELIVFGGREVAPVLNDLSERMRQAGAGFDDWEFVDLGGELPVKVVTALPWVKDEYTVQVSRALGVSSYEIMQVLIPDTKGRFPGEDDCDSPYRDVPKLWRPQLIS